MKKVLRIYCKVFWIMFRFILIVSTGLIPSLAYGYTNNIVWAIVTLFTILPITMILLFGFLEKLDEEIKLFKINKDEAGDKEHEKRFT